jgi:hypothetical protein
MNHYIYKISNPETGEYYYGRRSTKKHWKEDKYFGSSRVLRKYAGNKKPTQERLPGWKKEVLLLFDNLRELCLHEKIVIGDKWKSDPLCLNGIPGGEYNTFSDTELLSDLGKKGVSKALENGNHISKKDPKHMRKIGALGSKGKKWMTNQEADKLVKPEAQQHFLDQGWTFGRSDKVKQTVSAKTKEAMADPNIMENYMKGRWYK